MASIIDSVLYSDTYFVYKRHILNLISDTGCGDKQESNSLMSFKDDMNRHKLSEVLVSMATTHSQ